MGWLWFFLFCLSFFPDGLHPMCSPSAAGCPCSWSMLLHVITTPTLQQQVKRTRANKFHQYGGLSLLCCTLQHTPLMVVMANRLEEQAAGEFKKIYKTNTNREPTPNKKIDFCLDSWGDNFKIFEDFKVTLIDLSQCSKCHCGVFQNQLLQVFLKFFVHKKCLIFFWYVYFRAVIWLLCSYRSIIVSSIFFYSFSALHWVNCLTMVWTVQQHFLFL